MLCTCGLWTHLFFFQLEISSTKVNTLNKDLQILKADEDTLDSMTTKDLDSFIDRLQKSLNKCQLKKASMLIDLKEKCPVCWNKDKEVAFTCGHQTCTNCSSQIENCPICRQIITMKIKLF